MASNVGSARRDVRYEPDETPPNLLSLGLGLQHAMIVVPGIVLSPALLIQSAGGSEAYVMWAVCTALVICGVTTAVQAMPVGRIGAGYVMMMGTSSAFLAISVSALEQGGPGLLATLIIVSSLFQFALAARLSALRRIFTPTVAGTVVMLIPVTLSPILLRRLGDVPEAASPTAAPRPVSSPDPTAQRPAGEPPRLHPTTEDTTEHRGAPRGVIAFLQSTSVHTIPPSLDRSTRLDDGLHGTLVIESSDQATADHLLQTRIELMLQLKPANSPSERTLGPTPSG